MRKHFVRAAAAWLSALAMLTSSVPSLNLANMEDNKKLHKYSNEYSRLNCDAATVDTSGGGTLTLKLSGLSNGTHFVKTYIAGAGAGGTSVTGWDYLDTRYIKETKEGTYTYKGSKQGIIDSLLAA